MATANSSGATTSQDTGPLDWRIAIVTPAGKPTPEFQRRWNLQRNNNGLIGSFPEGSGPPTGTPTDGQQYVDTSSTPPTLYTGINGSWEVVGVQTFIELSDVPSSYAAKGGYIVAVNSGATGLTFDTLSGLIDSLVGTPTQGDILYRSSTGWVALAPGVAGYVLQTNGTGANPSWVAQTGGGGSTQVWLPLVTGDLSEPAPQLISDPYGQCIGVRVA